MLYTKPFYITKPVGNNAFSFEERIEKQLYVPSIKEISSLDEIELWDEIVFSDVQLNWKLWDFSWLKNFYSWLYKGKNIFLFDNHNHAYYFWHYARLQGIIWNGNILYHIDEHADTRVPEVFLSASDIQDEKKIFEYTNFVLNVGNYIIPAKQDGLIWDIIQIRSEENIDTLWPIREDTPIILNLDLDFFEPELDYISYEKKKNLIIEIAQKATLITVATSPYFINQELALKVFRDIFEE